MPTNIPSPLRVFVEDEQLVEFAKTNTGAVVGGLVHFQGTPSGTGYPVGTLALSSLGGAYLFNGSTWQPVQQAGTNEGALVAAATTAVPVVNNGVYTLTTGATDVELAPTGGEVNDVVIVEIDNSGGGEVTFSGDCSVIGIAGTANASWEVAIRVMTTGDYRVACGVPL